MTDTADIADYVLPATTQLEHLDVHTSYGHTYALINEPAIAPLGEAKPNTQIFRELAARMGFDDPCFADSDETLARIAFRPRCGRLRRAAPRRLGQAADCPTRRSPTGGFPTPSGRCLIDSPGFGVPDHLPNYEARGEHARAGARAIPLAMISPPARNFLNSSFVNVTSLRDIEGEPLVEIHADDAAPRGIATGGLVRVFNDRGSYLCKAVVSERARPGVVNGLGVWWRKLGAERTNVNELTHQRLTDIGRAPSFYDCLVEVQAGRRRGPVTAGRRSGALLGRRRSCWFAAPCSRTAAAAASATTHDRSAATSRSSQRAAGAPTGWPIRRRRRRCSERLALSQRIRDFAVTELERARQRELSRATPT